MTILNHPELRTDVPLAPLTTYKRGGTATWFLDLDDPDELDGWVVPDDVPILVLGRGSNLVVADGGFPGLVLRLGTGSAAIEIDDDEVFAGGAASLPVLARTAAQADRGGLSWFVGIPGSVGGAVRMNAGCYGTYVADVFQSAQVVLRDGSVVTRSAREMAFGYRSSDLPTGAVIVSATFAPPTGQPEELDDRMQGQLAKRDATQPTKDRTAGSTFRNPAGYSSTGLADDIHDLKAWKVIDDAGMRGARRGGAIMNEMHSNFLTNAGGATAEDLEELGEAVRKEVYATSGITLEWEIMRIGEKSDASVKKDQE